MSQFAGFDSFSLQEADQPPLWPDFCHFWLFKTFLMLGFKLGFRLSEAQCARIVQIEIRSLYTNASNGF